MESWEAAVYSSESRGLVLLYGKKVSPLAAAFIEGLSYSNKRWQNLKGQTMSFNFPKHHGQKEECQKFLINVLFKIKI